LIKTAVTQDQHQDFRPQCTTAAAT